MAQRRKMLFFCILDIIVLATLRPLFCQQLNLQTSFLPGATVKGNASKPATGVSQPSDRTGQLLQKAEQRFQRGKRLYQARDFDRARKEFDGAVDAMLEAGEFASNPPAYEKRLDEMVDAIHRYDLAGLGAATELESAQFEKAPLEDILEMTFPVDPKLKNKVKDELQATASQLPLTVNDAVLGYIHYFSGRGRKTMLAGLERAGRYRPLIQRILDEEGLPQELIHLAQAESGFLPRAVSRKAATGMWQFVAWRGQQYGLMQTKYTDDRLDPEKATRAAARHLRDLYNQFGDWYLAIAAYNCGPGVVERAVERTGYADFWELRGRRVLPAETTNYVPIILAFIIMVKNAPEYGLDMVVPDPPVEYDSLEIASPTHLALVADLTDTPVSELLALNPALLKGVAPAGYALRVPKGSGSPLMAALQMIPAERRASWRMHTVASGETLTSIGRRYGAAPKTIAEANRLAFESPMVGDRLLIPAAYQPARTVRKQVRSRAGTTRRVASSRTASARKGKSASTVRSRSRRPVALARTASARVRPGASGQ